jgi:hypothetical protein
MGYRRGPLLAEGVLVAAVSCSRIDDELAVDDVGQTSFDEAAQGFLAGLPDGVAFVIVAASARPVAMRQSLSTRMRISACTRWAPMSFCAMFSAPARP